MKKYVFPKLYEIDPKPLSDDELDQAYLTWLRTFAWRESDHFITPFLEVSAAEKGRSLLREARRALLHSRRSASRKLGKSESIFQRYETSEASGGISIESLRKAAEAIDCELVYAIRPKQGLAYSRVVWNKLAEPNRYRKNYNNCVARFRPNLLNSFVRDQIRNTKFRTKMGWTKKLSR